MSDSPIDWAAFCRLIHAAQRIVLTGHVRPDCDCLGSELGLLLALEALGKEVRIINADSTPENIRFIDPATRVESLEQGVTAADVHAADTLVVIDTSAWSQLGAMADIVREFSGQRIVLDHHVSHDDLQAAVFKDSRAEAAGRLVFDAIAQLKVPLSAEMARPLFAAMATDTGWFRFSSVTGSTYRVLGALVDAGASPTEIYHQLYEQHSIARLHLQGRILAGAQTLLNGRLIHTSVQLTDFTETCAARSDTDEVINKTLQVAGTEVAAMFVEQAPDQIKLSLRSRTEFDCTQVTEQFGGGGHRAAAGATISGTLADVRRRVLDAVLAEMG